MRKSPYLLLLPLYLCLGIWALGVYLTTRYAWTLWLWPAGLLVAVGGCYWLSRDPVPGWHLVTLPNARTLLMGAGGGAILGGSGKTDRGALIGAAVGFTIAWWTVVSEAKKPK